MAFILAPPKAPQNGYTTRMGLIAELKRRNVFRVAIAYVVFAWVLAQVTGLAFESFGAPEWVPKSVLFLLVLGLPIAIFFAWAF